MADLSGRVVTVRAAPAEVSERDVVALVARALVLDDDWKLRLDGLIRKIGCQSFPVGHELGKISHHLGLFCYLGPVR